MHILVCDDDAAFAARMDEYISEWFRAREIQVQSTVCTSGEQLLATPELERYQLSGGYFFRHVRPPKNAGGAPQPYHQ